MKKKSQEKDSKTELFEILEKIESEEFLHFLVVFIRSCKKRWKI